MAQSVDIALETVIADAESVFRRVERDQETVTVLHFGEPVAVITPAPIAKTIGGEHREQLEIPAEDSQYFTSSRRGACSACRRCGVGGGQSGENRAVKWRSHGACSTMAYPRSSSARLAASITTSPT